MKESAASEIKTASASVQRKAGASSPLFDEPGARNGPLMSIVQRAGCSGCPPALASLAGRMAEMPPGSRKEAALSLQRAKGNRFVQRLAVQAKEQAPPNKTCMPDQLKSGLENLSGLDLSGVRVHYSSSKPAKLNALAYTQGQEIHVGPGQEKHLPHEGWHVVQQAQGRVQATTQLKEGVSVNDNEGLEHEADVMGAKAFATGQELIAHDLTHMVQKQNVIQRYVLYNPGPGAGQYQTLGGANFTSQVTVGAGRSFIDPATQLPRLQNQAAPAVRVSQNSHLAIEDAQLTNRQPKFFYANAGMVPAWNDTLLAQGSFYELVVVAGPTLTIVMPSGAAQNLAKIEARNRAMGNQGPGMTTAQGCDDMVREVLGTIGREPKALFQHAPMPLPAANQVTQEILRHYYVAAELAYQAAGGGGGAGGGGAWGVGGMPANGVNFGNPDPAFNAVAANYGNAMNLHLAGANNAALDAQMQHLGVNEYAAPEVGQGLVTHKLGKETALPGPGGGTQQNDLYNARVVANPNNNIMWGFHWAGVIAKDGVDYITLENYARNAEDNHLPLSPADPRFYFQMYGANAQSWHAQWSAIGHGGREFVNPVSMVVAAEETPEVYEERAMRNFGNNINAIRYDHHTLAVVGATDDQLRIGLLKGLAYAKDILDNNAWGNKTTVDAWMTAVTNVANPAVAALRGHVLARLGEIWRIPIVGR